MSQIPVILDTDIGTDVDDLLALALALRSPRLRLLGITCVYGDVGHRARIVQRVLDLYDGRSTTRIPVVLGARQPLLRLRPVYWAGHEGDGLITPAGSSGEAETEGTRQHAADFIVDVVRRHPGQVHLVAIGPLTNVAQALLTAPEIAGQLRHLTLMGGAIRGPHTLHLPYAEHNIRSDPEAAHIVLTSGAPVTMVPLDVTTRVRLRSDGVERIRTGGSAFHAAVADQIDRYPPFAERGYINLHDPLALGTVLRPEIVRTKPVHVEVELGGRVATGATLMREPARDGSPRVDVAIDVEADSFLEFFLDRVGGKVEPCRTQG